MLSAVSSALADLLDMIGEVLTSLLTNAGTSTPAGALNPLLPLIAIGVSISIVLLVGKIIKSFCWGA